MLVPLRFVDHQCPELIESLELAHPDLGALCVYEQEHSNCHKPGIQMSNYAIQLRIDNKFGF
ncbi:hypothetical protein D3C72_2204050 [compost metagenome]